jgi:tripartite-type tricarboxylate transporter receptor subunit TctC
MNIPRRLLLAAICVPLVTQAQDAWPDKPVKLIVPFTAGGPTDTVARLMATQLQAIWKQPVVVDYKPGAGTVLGTSVVAKAPADGYTLGIAISALTINPSLQANLPYDTKKDLVGVSQVAQAHFGLFAHPSLPANTVPELIAYAKKNPDALSASPRRARAPARTWPARCWRTWRASGWFTCRTRAAHRRSRT